MLNLLINLFKREPDYIIQREEGVDYMHRWWVIPRNMYFNIYLHKFLGSDDARALHCHPWYNMSILLKGSYKEILPTDKTNKFNKTLIRKAGNIVIRKATSRHRIELFRDSKGKEIPVWSLFITGPVIRTWGFYCPQGFVHWKTFTSNDGNTSKIGRGCD